MKKKWKSFVCLILAHDWTCLAAEGVQPTEIQRRTRAGFLEYACEWCRRCEATCEPSVFLLTMADAVFSEPKPKPKPQTHNSRWSRK